MWGGRFQEQSVWFRWAYPTVKVSESQHNQTEEEDFWVAAAAAAAAAAGELDRWVFLQHFKKKRTFFVVQVHNR